LLVVQEFKKRYVTEFFRIACHGLFTFVGWGFDSVVATEDNRGRDQP
jgi:hypothetical protein